MTALDYIQTANDVYKTIYSNSIEIPSLSKEKMVLVGDKKLSPQELRQKLSYYVSWIAFYQKQTQRWKFIYSWLDNHTKSEEARIRLRYGKAERGQRELQEAKIEMDMEYLRNAVQIAKSKAYTFQCDLHTAEYQKEIVSRQITLLQIEIDTLNRE